MAKQLPSGVKVSFEDDGKVRIRRFVVVRTSGACVASYTALRSRTDQLAVGNRREWDMVCTLDGRELPMVADPYSNTGWRINRDLTPDELERVKCSYSLPLKQAS